MTDALAINITKAEHSKLNEIALENIPFGAGGELQLTDGIAQLLKEQQVLAYAFEGIRYDCGNKLGFLKATVEYALKHSEVAEEFQAYLDGRCGDVATACKLSVV